MRKRPTADVWFDREISLELLRALKPEGPFHSIIERRNHDIRAADPGRPPMLDVQLRKIGGRSWTSLYVGLTAVLNVEERDGRQRGRQFKLSAHPAYRDLGFHDSWGKWQERDELAKSWRHVEKYLDQVIRTVSTSHLQHTDKEGRGRKGGWVHKEGWVHAEVCSGKAASYRVVNREASPAFKDQDVKKTICDPLEKAITSALKPGPTPEAWWPGVRNHGKHKRLGTNPDVLAVDQDGRILVIEIKPCSALEGITRGPAQVRFYAELIAEWWRQDPEVARKSIKAMLRQRIYLSLTADGSLDFGSSSRVVPVLAIGPERTRSQVVPKAEKSSPRALDRAAKVARALDRQPPNSPLIDPLEIWLLDESGERVGAPIVPTRSENP